MNKTQGFEIIMRSQVDPTQKHDCVFRACCFPANFVHEMVQGLEEKRMVKMYCCAQHDAILTATHVRTGALVLDQVAA